MVWEPILIAMLIHMCIVKQSICKDLMACVVLRYYGHDLWYDSSDGNTLPCLVPCAKYNNVLESSTALISQSRVWQGMCS